MTQPSADASLPSDGASNGDASLRQLGRRLLGQLAQASRDYALVEPGDHVLVAVSGGKDSYALLDLLRQLQHRTPFRFSLVAVNIDQGHPGYPRHVLEDYLAREGYPAEFVMEDTYSVVKEKIPEGKTYCSLCSRLRRGILYTTAKRLGANKIALGHHRDDFTETLLLNLFYAGQISAMPPRLVSDDGANIVIRPLCYAAEEDIAAYARLRGYPILPCDLCGSQENLKRQRIKQLITELNAENPHVRGNLFAALGNVRPSQLLPPKVASAAGLPDRRLRVVSEP
ncbi:MAG: tRNA 2-thiocytidine(32) synthetase TtcA [Deltaproteobacteria bacterium]